MTMHLIPILILVCCTLSHPTWAEDYEPPTISPEDLGNYRFSNQPPSVEMSVEELSLGQRFAMTSQRGDVEDLISRHLGIMKLRGNQDDLSSMQQLVDKKVVKDDNIATWQAMGLVIGDLIADEFDLHWVSVEDEFGVSKALQWKDTKNFVFPITFLSKRIKFGEKIDILQIYEKLRADIEGFKAYEAKRPRMKLPGAERLSLDPN